MSIRRCFFETKRNICGFLFFNTGQEIVSEQFGDPVVVKIPGCPEGMVVPLALGYPTGANSTLWHTILPAKSSVLYLLRPRAVQRGCSGREQAL